MANIFQKFIFSISTAAPVLIVAGAVLWIQTKNDIKLPIIFIALGIIISIYNLLFIKLCRKKIAVTPITVLEITPNDTWSIIYCLTYLLPFANVVIKDFNIYISIAIAIIIALLLSLSNIALPNPLLLFLGFHFYKVMDESGTCDCFLISRKKSATPKSIKLVHRVFNYFLIEKR